LYSFHFYFDLLLGLEKHLSHGLLFRSLYKPIYTALLKWISTCCYILFYWLLYTFLVFDKNLMFVHLYNLAESKLNFLNLSYVFIAFFLQGPLDLQLYVQSVHISIKVVSSNPVRCSAYSIQHYVKKVVIDLRLVGGFLRVLRCPPPIKLTTTI
jgi:hypothetical protein